MRLDDFFDFEIETLDLALFGLTSFLFDDELAALLQKRIDLLLQLLTFFDARLDHGNLLFPRELLEVRRQFARVDVFQLDLLLD